MTCEEARLKISWDLDGELAAAGREALRDHLEECPACAALHSQMTVNDGRIREALAGARPSEGFAARVAAAARKPAGRWRRRLALALGVAAALILGVTVTINNLKPPPLSVAVHGADSFHADSMGALRVFVLNAARNTPVGQAAVRVLLAGREVGLFRTGAAGSIDGSFRVPNLEDGPYALDLEIDSPIGKEKLRRQVTVKREYRLLLSSDKPLYQPGQTIHLRALALNAFTLKPRAGPARFEVMDSKGNRVFSHPVTLSDYGIASADFALADELNLGTYRIAIEASGLRQERSVEVAKYVLPKFKAELELDKPSYQPGQKIKGVVRAKYFFGKVVRGRVRAKVANEVIAGELKEDGTWDFEAPAPGEGTHAVEVTVTDTADHRETKSTVAIVSRQGLKVTLVAEGGVVVHGVPNTFYLVVSTPDGRAAKADLTLDVNGKKVETSTDDLGVATVPVEPPFRIVLERARDKAGNETRDLHRAQFRQGEFALRLDKPAYKGGETMTVTLLGGAGAGPVYVDLVKGGQLILAKALEGKELAIDLPPDLFGTLHVIAYRRDSAEPVVRVAYVNLPEGLQIRPRVAKETFRPGEEMPVDLEVLDRTGKPVQAALGLAVVDEAVYGLVESRFAGERQMLGLQAELIDTRGFLQADAAAIYQGPNPNAQRLVSGNGRAAPLPVLAENGFELRALKLREIIDGYNEVLFTVAKAVGVILAMGCIIAFLVLVVRGVARLAKTQVGGVVVGLCTILVLTWILAAVLMPGLLSSQKASNEPRILAGRRTGLEFPPSWSVAPPDQSRVAMRSMQFDRVSMESPKSMEPVRVREQFPETLYWQPQLITDEKGCARVVLPAADSITSWRLLADAVSRGGAMGYRQANLRVFQDFFVDIDFPVALTKGDRVHVPVAVYNYLQEAQTVTVRAERASWFEFLDEEEKKVALKPGEVSMVYFGLKVKEHGRKALTVFADGKMKDAIKRTVEIMEKGREVPVTSSERIAGRHAFKVELPADAIEGASVLYVRLTPGISDLVAGLEGMIRLPHG